MPFQGPEVLYCKTSPLDIQLTEAFIHEINPLSSCLCVCVCAGAPQLLGVEQEIGWGT